MAASPRKWCEASLSTLPGRCSLSLRSGHHPGRAKADAARYFLIARPPLLAVMRGGEFAFLKMTLNLDSCAVRTAGTVIDLPARLDKHGEQAKPMFHLRELISVLCLVLLAWTLIAPAGAPDVLFVLPVIGTLWLISITQRVSPATTFRLRVLDPSISFISLRAPPQQ